MKPLKRIIENSIEWKFAMIKKYSKGCGVLLSQLHFHLGVKRIRGCVAIFILNFVYTWLLSSSSLYHRREKTIVTIVMLLEFLRSTHEKYLLKYVHLHILNLEMSFFPVIYFLFFKREKIWGGGYKRWIVAVITMEKNPYVCRIEFLPPKINVISQLNCICHKVLTCLTHIEL